jgi:putative DNA primase/helicase
MPNYARFMVAGNHDSMIAAGMRERRFLALEPSTHRVDDRQYWIELNTVIDAHGASAFLHYLLSVDLAGFNPYKAPATKTLIDEKLVNLKPSLAYLYVELSKEKAFDGTVTIAATDLVQCFKNWASLNDIPMTLPAARSQLGRALKDLDILPSGRSDYKSGKVYKLPNSDILRERFALLLGHEVDELF